MGYQYSLRRRPVADDNPVIRGLVAIVGAIILIGILKALNTLK